MSLSFRIQGHGWTVPKPVESSEIERNLKWPEGWSLRYSGVKKRHWVDHPESNGELGAKAALKAMKMAGATISEIDLVIFAGATYDYTLPNQASVIKSKLDSESKFDIPCIDIDTTCLSFITGLEIAAEKLALSKATKILLISAEVSSNGLNPDNRETYSLFGDAAAAFILTNGSDMTILNALLRNYSSGVYDTIIEGSGNKKPPNLYPFTPETHTFKMNGKKLLRLAKTKIPIFMQELFSTVAIDPKDLDHCIPHQASKSGLLIFESCSSLIKHGVNVESTLEEYGNCIAASIPMTFSMLLSSGKVRKGHTCLLAGTSAGFGIGGIILKFNLTPV